MSARRRVWLVASLLLAIGLVAGQEVGGTFASFGGTTSNGVNSFSAASSFCNGSTVTASADADGYVQEDKAGSMTATNLDVQASSTKRRRTLVHFTLPSIPQYCAVTSATLQLFATTVASGHTINVARAATSWSEATASWTNQPNAGGTAVGVASATGWMSWTVTNLVSGSYEGGDYGFTVRDSADGLGTTGLTSFSSRESTTNPPQLSITFGSGSTDIAAPIAFDIQSANHTGGTAGKPELGDTLTYTFSEPVAPSSILSGWAGSSIGVVVRLNNNASNDTFLVYNSTNITQANLGQVASGANYTGSNLTFGASGTASTMVMSGSTVTVTLGTASGSPATGTAATMTWTPSTVVTDTGGNGMDGTAIAESGTADVDF